jgi:hypothetical protein
VEEDLDIGESSIYGKFSHAVFLRESISRMLYMPNILLSRQRGKVQYFLRLGLKKLFYFIIID